MAPKSELVAEHAQGHAPRMTGQESTSASLAPLLASLIADIAAGDQEAFCRFYDATVVRVYSVALGILGDPTAAEDVTLEVYLQAWRTAGRDDASRSSALGWILMTCRGRALEALQSPAAVPLEIDIGRRGLESLLPLERELLALAFYRGLGQGELAAQFGMPVSTVKKHLRAALRKLRSVVKARLARIRT